MGSTIRARFSHGTLKPLEAVELREGDEVTITIVSSRRESAGDWLRRSAAELWEGAYFSQDPKQSQETLEGFLSGVNILGLDEEVCKRFGQLRGSMRKRGQTIGDFDLLIAATALHHNLTLLTNNRKHFEGIAGLEIESR